MDCCALSQHDPESKSRGFCRSISDVKVDFPKDLADRYFRFLIFNVLKFCLVLDRYLILVVTFCSQFVLLYILPFLAYSKSGDGYQSDYLLGNEVPQ